VLTRNHEEEVGLRLQFEAKVNQLNSDKRELLIKQDRTDYDLKETKVALNKSKQKCDEQGQELVRLLN
jgi:hypothetical protein